MPVKGVQPLLGYCVGAEDGRRYQSLLKFSLIFAFLFLPCFRDFFPLVFHLFDFSLSKEDMKAIEALDGGESLFFSHYDPKIVEWFMSMV